MTSSTKTKVFHTAIWTDSSTDLKFSLGLEGAVAEYADAVRVAWWYERLGIDAEFRATRAPFTRYGIMTIDIADFALPYPPPKTTAEIDEFIEELKAKFANEEKQNQQSQQSQLP